MSEIVTVSVSGPAFSLLLYENIKTEHDQEGFLLGNVIEKETKSITDNDQQVINIEKIIKINSVVPFPHTCYFYNASGKIDKLKIKKFMGEHARNVVAWYKHKNMPGFKLTLREKIVHKQLSEIFAPTADLFSCCLLTTESSDNLSTHLYSQTFIRRCGVGYKSIPMHIVNLSDPNNTYMSAEPSSDTFTKIVKSLKIDLKKGQGLNTITKIQIALQNHIDQLVNNLSDSEKKMFDLEQEVKQLKQTVRWGQETDVSAQYLNKSSETFMENGSGDHESVNSTPSSSKQNSPEVQRKIRGRRGSKQTNIRNKQSEVGDTPESDAVKTRSRSKTRVAQRGKN